jgi:retron-type reverse transcriptase|tara:strand:- start:56983 stop:58344 length:1362 start_codon:yes stop_codon:yes gene_type:complete
MEVKAVMTERKFNLVVPLPHKGTDMRTKETSVTLPARSCAVSPLNNRPGDVDSTMSPAMPGIRTSTTAIRTTTTRVSSFAPVPSADWSAPADFTFGELIDAYFDCRERKRNSASALAFEEKLEDNLRELHDELVNGHYRPGKSVCFIITHPKPREVWAATFRDRVVHHLLHNKISPRFTARFIADSCACIPGRGTAYAATRLESKARSITQNWSRPAHYMKCDLANFFVSIDKRIVRNLLARHIHEPWWLQLADTILFHDPRENYELRGNPALLKLVPPHKRLCNQPSYLGLPIGNLSSQFFANVYLNVLDQFVKHSLKCRHYIRYVDDFVLLHESPQWLNQARHQIETVLQNELNASLNPKKTILQPLDRGVDFVGQVIRPWHRTLRRRTFNLAMDRVRSMDSKNLYESANSYYGLLRQASHSHHDRARFSNQLRRRGHTVKGDLTKTYRKH